MAITGGLPSYSAFKLGAHNVFINEAEIFSVMVLHLTNISSEDTAAVKEATIAIKSTTTRMRMVKSTSSTSEVACYENCSDESHNSEGQELSALEASR